MDETPNQFETPNQLKSWRLASQQSSDSICGDRIDVDACCSSRINAVASCDLIAESFVLS